MAEIPTGSPSGDIEQLGRCFRFVPVPAIPECPTCLRPMAKPHKCKTLYGVTVCNKCRNGFANRRQAAYLVDIALYAVLTYTIIFAAAAVGTSGPTGFNPGGVLVIVFGWLIFPFLFTFKDAFNGRSPGKMLFGVRVVDAQSRQPISPSQSMRRNLVLMIPYVGVIGGVITMMRGQRWGNKWAGTMVIWNKHEFREPFAPAGRYCRSCGYDLTGNTSGRCPECGLEILAAAYPIALASPVNSPAEEP